MDDKKKAKQHTNINSMLQKDIQTYTDHYVLFVAKLNKGFS